MSKGDYVVLLHGIARTSRCMNRLQAAFAQAGYQVLNIDYPSRKHGIAELADHIAPQIGAFATDKTKKIHFVGYSMGGLVARAYIAGHRPDNLGRVVMLGTPNGGSEVADFLKGNLIYNWYYGPAGQELVTQADRNAIFGKVDYDLGVIAGTRTIDPVSSYLLIKGPGDGKVSVASTQVEGMKGHLVLPVTHTFMPQDKAVIAATLGFIGQGAFPVPPQPGRGKNEFNP